MLFDTIMQAFGREGARKLQPVRRQKKAGEDMQQIRGAHVLLVEDNEINQQVASEILTGAGFKVSIANNGLEAVNLVKENAYDAILMDVQMPVMDGYAATRQIRKWEGGRGNAEVGMRNEEVGRGNAEVGMRNEEVGGGNAEVGRQNKIDEDSDFKSQIPNPKSQIENQASNLQPLTSNIPIIAMTAHAMTGDHEKSLVAGMVDHVTKPIDPDHLFATLRKWIRPREASPAAVEPTTGVSGPSAPEITQAPLDRAAAGAADAELPDMLPGFDLADGLRRLQGNRQLYRKLLINFAAGYAKTGTEIRQALDASDFGQAHSLVHSLKGVAGNLSADGLQAATVELEKLVKHADKNEPPPPDALNYRLAALEKAMGQALEAARTLKAPQAEAAEPAAGPVPALPPEVAQRAARRLRAAAEMGDVTEVVSIADEIASQTNGFSPYRAKIAQLADDFDFDGILQLTDQLDNSADLADS